MAQADKKPKGKVVARGQAPAHTDDELDEMTSADAMEALAEDAADDWRENAPKSKSTLLDAKETN